MICRFTSWLLVYLPMQKSLKMLPNSSSTSTFPTIMPRCLVANLRSSAAISKFFEDLNLINFSKWWTQFIKFCRCLSLVIKISSEVINLFFNLCLIFNISLSTLKFFFIDIKAWSYFLNFWFNFPLTKSDLFTTKIALFVRNFLKTPVNSALLAETITNLKSASSALFKAILIPFFSISFFELLIPAVSETITG